MSELKLLNHRIKEAEKELQKLLREKVILQEEKTLITENKLLKKRVKDLESQCARNEKTMEELFIPKKMMKVLFQALIDRKTPEQAFAVREIRFVLQRLANLMDTKVDIVTDFLFSDRSWEECQNEFKEHHKTFLKSVSF